MDITRHRKYRPKTDQNREHRLNLRFNDEEYMLILKQASRKGLPPATWAAWILTEITRKNKY